MPLPSNDLPLKLSLEVAWIAMIAYARIKGYDFLARCMTNAAFNGGETLNYYNDSELFKKIQKQPEYQELIKKWVDEYKKYGKEEFKAELSGDVAAGVDPGLTFVSDADLVYTIHNMNVYGPIKNGNLEVHLIDTYDFEKMMSLTEELEGEKSFWNAFRNVVGNNIGHIMENLKYIDTFQINVYGYEWAGYKPGGSQENPPTTNEVNRYFESGKCTVTASAIKFRAKPYVGIGNNNPALGQYNKNESVNYDLIVMTDDYVWVSWIGMDSGERRYMPIIERKTGDNWTQNSYSAVTDKEINRYLESGKCTVTASAIKFRAKPYVGMGNDNPALGQYNKDEFVYYDLVVITDNYVWVSWIGISSGERRYMPITDRKNGSKWAYCV